MKSKQFQKNNIICDLTKTVQLINTPCSSIKANTRVINEKQNTSVNLSLFQDASLNDSMAHMLNACLRILFKLHIFGETVKHMLI